MVPFDAIDVKGLAADGELHFRSFGNYCFSDRGEDDRDEGKSPVFDWKRSYLPFSIDNQDGISPPADEFSKNVLRNLPFARRRTSLNHLSYEPISSARNGIGRNQPIYRRICRPEKSRNG